jgi:hypothetical protein
MIGRGGIPSGLTGGTAGFPGENALGAVGNGLRCGSGPLAGGSGGKVGRPPGCGPFYCRRGSRLGSLIPGAPGGGGIPGGPTGDCPGGGKGRLPGGNAPGPGGNGMPCGNGPPAGGNGGGNGRPPGGGNGRPPGGGGMLGGKGGIPAACSVAFSTRIFMCGRTTHGLGVETAEAAFRDPWWAVHLQKSVLHNTVEKSITYQRGTVAVRA